MTDGMRHQKERKKKRKKQWSTGEDWEESGVKICRQVNAQKSGGFTQTCGGPTSTDRIPVLLPVMGPIVDPHLEEKKQESNLAHVGEMGSPHMGKNGCDTPRVCLDGKILDGLPGELGEAAQEGGAHRVRRVALVRIVLDDEALSQLG